MRTVTCLLLALSLIHFSCTKEHDYINIDEEPFEPKTFVETNSLVISVVPKMHFSCWIDGQRYISQIPGVLVIEDLLLEQGATPVLIQADGHFDELRYLIPSPAARMNLQVRMQGHQFFEGFQASEGGTITIQKVEIEIDPNSIVDQNGNEFTGEVKAMAKRTSNVLYFSESRLFPQNHFVLNGNTTTLNLAGGLDVTLIDNDQNPLFLKENSIATLSVEIRGLEYKDIPETLEIIAYNSEKEQWERLGQIEKNGDRWHGSVLQLGRLLWGEPIKTQIAQVSVKSDEGFDMPNEMVMLSVEADNPMSFGFTDNDGLLRMHVPLERDFRLNSVSLCIGYFFSQEYSAVEEVSEGIANLENFVFEPTSPSKKFNVFNGNVIDCLGNILEKSVIHVKTKYNQETLVFSDDNGNMNFVTPKCNTDEIEISVFDFEKGELLYSYAIKNGEGTIVDVGSLMFCSEYEHFVTYEIEGKVFPFPIETQLISTFTDPIYTSVLISEAFEDFETNDKTFIYFDHEEPLTAQEYSIKSISANFDNVLQEYVYNCPSECEGSLTITQITDEYYEGILSYYDDSVSNTITGGFRAPRY